MNLQTKLDCFPPSLYDHGCFDHNLNDLLNYYITIEQEKELINRIYYCVNFEEIHMYVCDSFAILLEIFITFGYGKLGYDDYIDSLTNSGELYCLRVKKILKIL